MTDPKDSGVPPEYADLYEQAYRRGYAEGIGGPVEAPGTPDVAGDDSTAHSAPEPTIALDATALRSQVREPAEVVDRASQPPLTPTPPGGRRRNRGGPGSGPVSGNVLAGAGIVGAVLLVVLGAVLLGRLLAAPDEPDGADGAKPTPIRGPSKTAEPSRSDSPADSASDKPAEDVGKPAGRIYRGPISVVPVSRASVGCTSPAGHDDQGNRTSYAVGNVLDTDPATAWRCDGRAVGQKLRLDLGMARKVVSVALVPGYAKTDPSSGADRYAENNRITEVRWTFGDGHSVRQRIRGSRTDRTLRVQRLVPVRTRTVELRIVSVSPGPRNTTAISTVQLGVAG